MPISTRSRPGVARECAPRPGPIFPRPHPAGRSNRRWCRMSIGLERFFRFVGWYPVLEDSLLVIQVPRSAIIKVPVTEEQGIPERLARLVAPVVQKTQVIAQPAHIRKPPGKLIVYLANIRHQHVESIPAAVFRQLLRSGTKFIVGYNHEIRIRGKSVQILRSDTLRSLL